MTDRYLAANGQQLDVMGQVKVSCRITQFSWPIKVIIVKGLSVDMVLGCDFFERTGLKLDYGAKAFAFKFAPDQTVPFCKCRTRLGARAVTNREGEFDLDHLAKHEAKEVRAVLDQFPNVLTDRLGVTNKITYKIELTDSIPVKQSPYRLAPPKMKALRGEVEKMLAAGVIRPSVSPYASPMFLVKKPNGGGVRPVVDYRQLNRKVVLQSVPLPDLHNCFSWFAGARYFTVLDLNQAYYQIPLAEESKSITAFCTDWNLYEFNRVPFGLSTGAAVLSRLLDMVLGDVKFKFVYNYLDDVVIYSRSFGEHLEHIRTVLDRLAGAGLTVKPSKLNLVRSEISFLGHLVSGQGIRIDPSRTQAIFKFRPPTSKKGIARFIGMINYFRKFIPRFAELAAPLNALRKKNERFVWGESQEAAFRALKDALGNAPVLAVPDFEQPFVLQTDASNSGVAAVLLQMQGGERRPVAYASRGLTDAERKYSTYELEALAVLFGLERYKFYLEHRRFTLETDNQALSWVLARPRKTGRIARWAVRISAFQFDVRHIKGSENVVADALSRMFEEQEDNSEEDLGGIRHEGMVAAVLGEVPELFGDVGERQDRDRRLSEIKQRIVGGGRVPGYEVRRGILCASDPGGKGAKICLPEELVAAVFRYYHQSLLGGHLGLFKTLNKIREHVTWPTLYKDVKRLVRQCHQCQQAKPSSGVRHGLLNSERAERPMQKLFIDYIGPFPRSQSGHKYIMVVVDDFSRFCWLLPSYGMTAGVSIKHLRTVFSWFGPPTTLVSDNAPAFSSGEFRRFCFVNGVRHITTTPYYPQPSLAERMNRNLKSALIAFHCDHPSRWETSLGWLNFAFNTARHEAHLDTPAALMFAHPVNSPLANLWEISELLPEKVTPAGIRETWQRAKRNMARAHKRLEARYNKGRKPARFAPGDLVYTRYTPGRDGRHQVQGKLAPRFVGPWRVIDTPSPVTLRVRDEATGLEHRVHVSHVKPALPK